MPTLSTPNTTTRYYRIELSHGICFFKQDSYKHDEEPIFWGIKAEQISEEEFDLYADTPAHDNTPALDAGAESARKAEQSE